MSLEFGKKEADENETWKSRLEVKGRGWCKHIRVCMYISYVYQTTMPNREGREEGWA